MECMKRKVCYQGKICCNQCKLKVICLKSCFYHRKTKKVDLDTCQYLRPVPLKLREIKEEKESLKQLEREKERFRKQLQKKCIDYDCSKCPLPDPNTCTRQRTFNIACYMRKNTTLIDCHRVNKSNNRIKIETVDETEDEMFYYWISKVTIRGRNGALVVQSIDRFGKHNCYIVGISGDQRPFPCEFGNCTQPYDLWDRMIQIAQDQREGRVIEEMELEEYR